MTQLPLFPLHTVLCPGVALPLHIFEERYRRMIGRCLDRGEPFGVVLIRQGREVGSSRPRLSPMGTTALIREAGRYPDGRMDVVTVGGTRFLLGKVEEHPDGYLVGQVRYVDEQVGDERQVTAYAERVRQRFLDYLEMLQPALDDEEGQPEIEVEIEVETEGESEAEAASSSGLVPAGADEVAQPTPGTDEDRRELLMAAARRLTAPGDPTALSYVITGLVQVELPARQMLLEAPDTASRLRRLDAVLAREIQLLGRGLKPLLVESRVGQLRRN